MILVPLPFFVSLLLITILVQTLRRDEEALRAHPLFALLMVAYGVQSVLIGLRWGYDMRGVLPFMSPLAALIAPLAWLSFRGLTIQGATITKRSIGPHLLPAAGIVTLMVLWPDPVGVAIVIVFLGYGAALLWLARRGPDVLVASRLDGVVLSYRAMRITGIALLASAGTDLLVSADFAWSGGLHSGAVIAAANVVALLVLGSAASIASSNAASASEQDAPPSGAVPIAPETSAEPTGEERRISLSLETLMRERAAYRDVELNLTKIARRLAVPARDVSRAVNRVHGVSVSQYVNTLRVEEACRLLLRTDSPVTKIMFDAGFMTKSNFNREFHRVKGASPTIWRRSHQAEGAINRAQTLDRKTPDPA